MLEAVGVVAGHRGGGLEQARGGAVGQLQVDAPGGGEVALEVQDVPQLGPAPAVDGLVGVADDEDVVAVFGELAQQDVLREVRVLVLVDQDAAEALAGGPPRVGVLVEQAHSAEQQVVEVEAGGLCQRGLVGGSQPRVAGGVLVGVPAVEAGGDAHPVLDHAHPVDQRLRLVDAGVDAGVPHALAHDADLLALVGDPEVGGDAHGGAVLAQQAAAEAVKGGDPHRLRLPCGQHRAQARSHFVGRLAGEGDGGDGVRLGPAGAHQVRDARADDAGLSRSRAGDHQDRPVGGGDRLALAVVEAGEQALVVVSGRMASGGGHRHPGSYMAVSRYGLGEKSRRTGCCPLHRA